MPHSRNQGQKKQVYEQIRIKDEIENYVSVTDLSCPIFRG